MQGPLFGLETEVLAAAFGPGSSPGGSPGGSAASPLDLCEEAMREARERLPHLDCWSRRGVFLSNGMKLYVDHGAHLEICTPECSSPTELVRYALAGERILADLSRHVLARRDDLSDVIISTCGVDYSGRGACWGGHENYLSRRPPGILWGHLVPFLVSRVVFTGAGGFDNRFPGLRFLLSPRVRHLDAVCSAAGSGLRSIIHLKDEPLGAGVYGRLHIICGETNASPRATWLKVGSTALVVEAIQAGYTPECRSQILNPLKAMRAIAGDPELRVRIPLASGEAVSAIEVQRAYLRMVEDCLAEEAFADGPARDWAPSVCAWWRRVLDALEEAPETLDTVLDWRAKRSLYAEWARRKGFSPDDVEGWNRAMEVFLREASRPGFPPPRAAFRRVEAVLGEWMLSPKDLGRFLELRESLFEADTRYGLVDGRGIHEQLALRGVLGDEVEGVGDVAAAVETPPAGGRARIRGEAVRRLSPRRKDYLCDWHAVVRFDADRLRIDEILDLTDPFADRELWRKDVGGVAGIGRATGISGPSGSPGSGGA